MRLTRKGAARYQALNDRFMAIAATMGAESSEGDIRKTTAVVRRISDNAAEAFLTVLLRAQRRAATTCIDCCGPLGSTIRSS